MSTRITDLPQAEVLNGSEIMPLVQNGVTKKATLDFINLAATIDFQQAGAGAVVRTMQDKAREVVSVKDFGAVGDGVTDDTAAIQAAITAAAEKTLWIDGGTFIVTHLTASSSFSIRGSGTIKRKDSASGVLLGLSGASVVYDFAGITLDGNQVNQTPLDSMHTLSFTASGTTSVQAKLVIQGITFLNGNGADVTVYNSSDRSTSNEFVGIYACRFLGGREGASTSDDPRYIDIRSPVSYVVDGCILDFLGTPTIGRAGIVCYDGWGEISTDKARGVIANNLLQSVGRSEPSSTLGAIDIYNYARSTTIVGNTIINPYGRGIQVKADAENLTISGNVVDGLSGSFLNGQIVVNSAQLESTAGAITIQGNSLLNSGNDGIVYTGRNLSGTTYARCISIGGNVITDAVRRAINIADVDDAVVANNVIDGADTGIYAQGVNESLVITGNRITDTVGNGIHIAPDNTTAWMNIQGNHIQDAGSRGIYLGAAAAGQITNNNIKNTTNIGVEARDVGGAFLIENNVISTTTPFSLGGTNSGLRVGPNMFATAPGFSVRELTIATGAITAFMDWHYIDTEADAATDDLNTINGGFDGHIVTFRAASSSRDVVFKDGTGNLRLAGDFTLTNSDDTITLRYMAGTWFELCRSDNAV
jgi:hypothetical protein